MERRYKESQMSLFSRSIFSSSDSSSESFSNGAKRDDNYSEDDEDTYLSSDSEVLVLKDSNLIKWVINNEAYCFDVNKFSEKLVQATFLEAKKKLAPKAKSSPVDIAGFIIDDIINTVLSTHSDSQSSDMNAGSSLPSYISSQNVIDWPKISEFNIKLGLERIEEYIGTWERQSDWLYCVEFLGFESEDCSNIFVYEVEWSKPTNAYPIPQATASVYFALEVFKMVPYNHDRNIEVTYIFECSSVIHQPGRIDFQEKWLEDLLDAKLRFFKSVTFSVPADYCSGPSG